MLVLSVLDLRKFRAYKGYMVKDLLRAMRNKVSAIYRMFQSIYVIMSSACNLCFFFFVYLTVNH